MVGVGDWGMCFFLGGGGGGGGLAECDLGVAGWLRWLGAPNQEVAGLNPDLGTS